MLNFSNPFLPQPFFSYKKNQNFYKYNMYNQHLKSNKTTKKNYSTKEKKDVIKKDCTTNNCNNSYSHLENSEVIFELFGIKIYFDDILIICILLFLYQEKIDDEYLLIALILLLLS